MDFGGLLERIFATYTGYMSIPLALLLPFWLIRNLFSIRLDIGGRPFAIVFMCNLFILQYLNAETPSGFRDLPWEFWLPLSVELLTLLLAAWLTLRPASS